MNWRRRVVITCATGGLITMGMVGLTVTAAQAARAEHCGSYSYVDSGGKQHVTDWNCSNVSLRLRGEIAAGPDHAYIVGPCVTVPGGSTKDLFDFGEGYHSIKPWKVVSC